MESSLNLFGKGIGPITNIKILEIIHHSLITKLKKLVIHCKYSYYFPKGIMKLRGILDKESSPIE